MAWLISYHWSLSFAPKNIRKTDIFCFLSGRYNFTILGLMKNGSTSGLSLTPEKLMFSNVFKSYRKRPAAWNGLTDQYFHFNPRPKWSSKSMLIFYFCFLPNKCILREVWIDNDKFTVACICQIFQFYYVIMTPY